MQPLLQPSRSYSGRRCATPASVVTVSTVTLGKAGRESVRTAVKENLEHCERQCRTRELKVRFSQ
jgi:hypothetical protein